MLTRQDEIPQAQESFSKDARNRIGVQNRKEPRRQLTAHACLRATHRQKGGDPENTRGRMEEADRRL